MSTYSVKRADLGILDQWSVMDGPVRVAIVAESVWTTDSGKLILVRGEVPADFGLVAVQAAIDQAKAEEDAAWKARIRERVAADTRRGKLKGGL